MKNRFESLESIIATILEENNPPCNIKNSIPMFDDYRTELEKFANIKTFTEAEKKDNEINPIKIDNKLDPEESKSDPLRNKVYREIKNTIGKKILRELMDKYYQKGEITDGHVNQVFATLYKNYFQDMFGGIKFLYHDISTKFDNSEERKVQTYIRHWIGEIQNDKTLTSPKNFLLQRLAMADPRVLKNFFEDYNQKLNRTNSPRDFAREFKQMFDRTQIDENDQNIIDNIDTMISQFDDNFNNLPERQFTKTPDTTNQATDTTQANQATETVGNVKKSSGYSKGGKSKTPKQQEEPQSDPYSGMDEEDQSGINIVISNPRAFEEYIWKNPIYSKFVDDMTTTLRLGAATLDKQMFDIIKIEWGANAVGFFEDAIKDDIITRVFNEAPETKSSDVKNMVLQQQHDYIAYVVFLIYLAGLTGIGKYLKENPTPQDQPQTPAYEPPDEQGAAAFDSENPSTKESELYDEGIASALTMAVGRTFKRMMGYDTFSKLSKKQNGVGKLIFTCANIYPKDSVFRKRIKLIDIELKSINLDIINNTQYAVQSLPAGALDSAELSMKSAINALKVNTKIPMMLFKNNSDYKPLAYKLGNAVQKGLNFIQGKAPIGGGQANTKIGEFKEPDKVTK